MMKNFDERFSEGKDFLTSPIRLNSTLTDYYTVLRMFTIFDEKTTVQKMYYCYNTRKNNCLCWRCSYSTL